MGKKTKLLKDNSFFVTLQEITHKNKIWRAISHEKKTHLAKSCITMKDLMIKFYEKLDGQFLPLYYLAHKKPISLIKLDQTDTIHRIL